MKTYRVVIESIRFNSKNFQEEFLFQGERITFPSMKFAKIWVKGAKKVLREGERFRFITEEIKYGGKTI